MTQYEIMHDEKTILYRKTPDNKMIIESCWKGFHHYGGYRKGMFMDHRLMKRLQNDGFKFIELPSNYRVVNG